MRCTTTARVQQMGSVTLCRAFPATTTRGALAGICNMALTLCMPTLHLAPPRRCLLAAFFSLYVSRSPWWRTARGPTFHMYARPNVTAQRSCCGCLPLWRHLCPTYSPSFPHGTSCILEQQQDGRMAGWGRLPIVTWLSAWVSASDMGNPLPVLTCDNLLQGGSP